MVRNITENNNKDKIIIPKMRDLQSFSLRLFMTLSVYWLIRIESLVQFILIQTLFY